MAQSRVSSLDNTNTKHSTITIAIIGHGEDLINEPISDDPNIRIFSRAGQPFCLGIGNQNMLSFVNKLYDSDERDENKNMKSSYQLLREVADHYNDIQHNTEFKDMCDRLLIEKPALTSSLKHTKQNIECQKNNQIYTPIYDHKYFFTDNTPPLASQNGIHILETINHISRGNIDFDNTYNINLAFKKYFIKIPDIRYRKIFNEEKIREFLKKFNLGPDLETNLLPDDKEALEHLRYRYPPQHVALNPKYKEELDAKTNLLLTNSKLKRYSKSILEKNQWATLQRLVIDLSRETSEIHELFNEEDDNILKAKTKELDTKVKIKMIKDKIKASEEKDEEKVKQIEQKIEEYTAEKRKFLESEFDGMIENIKLSEIIAFLKSEGFVVINIIDFTCRYVHKYLDDAYLLDLDESKLEEETEKEKKRKKEEKIEKIGMYEENQAMGSQELKQNIGGRKKRRTRRKKSKNSKKSRKGRKTRRNRK